MSKTKRAVKPKPLYVEMRWWVEHHQGKGIFSPFTGQDTQAWLAFVYACQLYFYSDTNGRNNAIIAMRAAACAAQPKTHAAFKQVIAGIGDWCHIEEIWSQIAKHTGTDPFVVDESQRLRSIP